MALNRSSAGSNIQRFPRPSHALNDEDGAPPAYDSPPCGSPASGRREPGIRSSFPGIHTRRRSGAHPPRMSEASGPAYPWPSSKPSDTPFGGLLASINKPFTRARAQVQGYTVLDWLQLFLPCVKWLRTYKVKEFLMWDIIAGVSVGFMVVPQGMSYANIAGVPSVFGLYGAFMPVLVYALFGSSRELAVGPVAVTSLLIASSLKELVPGAEELTNPNNPSPDLVPIQLEYNRKAIQLSLLVACMYTAVGVFNLGFLTNFLSHSVIGGFTSGAAIIIGMSQLKYILGYNVPRADKIHEQIHRYLEGIQGFVWQEYVMGVTILTLLLTMKFFGKRSAKLKWLRPLGPISACVIAMVAVVAGDLQDKGIKVVGNIPKGLPGPTVDVWFPMEDFNKLAPLAVVVMLVDLLESTSIARALAAKGKYDLHANQEIVGLGLANFAGSAFNAYSTTGSFSRSAVNYDSGCKTGLAGMVTACVVGLVLLVLTPVFGKLPLNVMGAIVISGVSGLFEYEQAVHLFKIRKLDWLVWMTSCLSTMFLGVEMGLAISIGLALLIVVYESAFPHTALLGRVGSTTIYRNVKQFPNSQVLPGIAACRVDAPMYFANVQYIHDRLRKYVSRATSYSNAAGVPLQYLLLDMSPVTHIDSTGAHLLETLHEELGQQGIQLGLCNPAAGLIVLLERTDFPDALGREWIFVRMHDAVVRCLATMVTQGFPIKPSAAINSSAVSPKRVQELIDSPLGRNSTRGSPQDTDATLVCAFDPTPDDGSTAVHSTQSRTSSLGGDNVVTIDPALAAALVPALSNFDSRDIHSAAAASRGIASQGSNGSSNIVVPGQPKVQFAALDAAAAAGDQSSSPRAPAAVPGSSSTAVQGALAGSRSPLSLMYGVLRGAVQTSSGSPSTGPDGQAGPDGQVLSRLSRRSAPGSSGGLRAAMAPGPYTEALLESSVTAPTGADQHDTAAGGPQLPKQQV